ncbi:MULTISPECIES: dicarboxylate/amino acid:cation symporter [unclassified Bacillus (in: firmicutes)]|uniref:dicarboxylate/amino acid:cation symporter n=1 Tax=unclassified Bacillus (in: firmicutes) TaxID=185979 RepID=UPI00080ACA30|nr:MULTISPECIES: dicarboxylate/amino acid:cation symporter [unclassified Bacillus (in: firmicutes)]OCA89922.1 sodium:proton antiporter [Bacillus sp. FJAT-27986]
MKRFGILPKIILAIFLGIGIGMIAPAWMLRIFTTFNGLFSSFLEFIIPFIIIGFIASGIGMMGKGAGKMLGITTGLAYASTIIAGLIAFFVAKALYPVILKNQTAQSFANPEEALLSPYFTIEMPAVMGVMTALLVAFTIGVGMASIKGEALLNVMEEFKEIVVKVINTIIIPLLPFHIFGIFANMTQGGQIASILSVFAKVFVMIIALHLFMLVIQYTVAGAASKKNPFKMLKTMLPAYFTALGTQSSASTIPVTVDRTKKMGVKDKVANFTVPLLATIHLSGSTITLVSCAMAVMLLQGTDASITQMLPFILMLGVTMIAAPGVPGGAVMAALGLLESMLGFSDNMLSLMIALYLAQDSFGTACNVTGDGAISALTERFVPKTSKEIIQNKQIENLI